MTMHPLEERFRTFIREQAFPCVGAKSALARGALETHVARSIQSGWDDLPIHERLLRFARKAPPRPGDLRSFAVLFERPRLISEAAFERAMWARIQSMSDKDEWLGQPLDPSVSPDPANPHFSLSFGGTAFFVVGLHPGASRPARRFEVPVMVFNRHDQFETLRAQGRYETMRRTIIERDVRLAGTANPMLARHGEASEARQYSGRRVGPDWRAPYRPRGSGKAGSCPVDHAANG